MAQIDGFDAALEVFNTKLNALLDTYYSINYPTQRPVITYEVGPKYVRVVRTSTHGQDRSVYGFIARETGALLKAASWKAPAKNFARGNIFKEGTAGMGPHSIG